MAASSAMRFPMAAIAPSPHLNAGPSPATLAFVNFIHNNKRRGRDGHRKERYYVPFSILDGYWEDWRIQEVIGNNSVTVPTDVIRNRFLRVFSILVATDLIQCLPEFTRHSLDDGGFPLTKLPTQWPDHGLHIDIFNKLQPEQWMFFPLEFHHDKLIDVELSPEHILPLVSEELLVDGDAAHIYKIEVDESCNMLENTAVTNPNVFVLKAYDDPEHKKLYDNEREALTALQDGELSEHIIAYYGSFEQNGTYYLILELVNDGNFLEYLERTPPPQTPQDIYDFWTSVIGLFKGFHQVHQLLRHHVHAVQFQVVHQDIKPDNIFLVRDPSSVYKFLPKIADFGCSHKWIVKPDDEDNEGRDRHGNATYSAPECSHHEVYLEPGPNGISTAADIFSIGCVLSEVASWLALGPRGSEEYAELRKMETRGIPGFQGSAYVGCFHNGFKALDAVKAMHARIISALCPFDNVTKRILSIIEEHMLAQDPKSRQQAKALKGMFEQAIGAAEGTSPLQSTTPSSPPKRPGPEPVLNSESSTPTRSTSSLQSFLNKLYRPLSSASPIVSSPTEPSTPIREPSPSYEVLTMSEAYYYREARKGNGQVDARVGKLVGKLMKSLANRDHIFFIDDSSTMAAHRRHVLHSFMVLSYLAKLIDTNGIELVLASNPTKVYKNVNTTQLIKILEDQRYDQMPDGLLEHSLTEFVEAEIIRRLPYNIKFGGQQVPLPTFRRTKPISVFIFTDGCWGPGLQHAGGVENPIRKLMTRIKDCDLNRTQVMIQFLRFGDDENGKRYLKILDDFGQAEGCDIVDTRPIYDEADVNDIFIGSLSIRRDKVQSPN